MAIHVAIDESGDFALEGNTSGIECVAAIVFRDGKLKQWDTSLNLVGLAGEKKGSSLNTPGKIDPVFSCLHSDIQAKAFVVVTSTKGLSKTMVEAHRKSYIESIRKATQDHPLFLTESVEQHIKHLEGLSLPNYLKTFCILKLIENIIRGVLGNTNTYSAKDLEAFTWEYDTVSKGTQPTIRYLIYLLLCGYASALPIRIDNSARIDHYLNKTQGCIYLDATKILTSPTFIPSESSDSSQYGGRIDSPGVKAADSTANVMRRALRGRPKLGNLESMGQIIHQPYGFDLVYFDKDKEFVEEKLTREIPFLQELKTVHLQQLCERLVQILRRRLFVHLIREKLLLRFCSQVQILVHSERGVDPRHLLALFYDVVYNKKFAVWVGR